MVPSLEVTVQRADGKKCERCWNYSIHVGDNPRYPTICERCSEAIAEIEGGKWREVKELKEMIQRIQLRNTPILLLPIFSLINFLHVLDHLLPMIIPRRLRWLWLTLAVVFLDRASKAWIDSRPEEYFPHAVIRGFLEIVRSHNPGIAFSFFADASSATIRYLLILGSVVIIGVIAWLLVASRHLNRLERCGVGLIARGRHGQRYRPHHAWSSHGFPPSVAAFLTSAHLQSMAGIQCGGHRGDNRCHPYGI